MSLALPFHTAKQLAAAIRKKKIGCVELLDVYLKRVETYQPRAQRHHRHRHRRRPQARQGRRQGGQGRRQARSPARRADDHQGVLRRRGPAHDLGQSGLQGQDRREEFPAGAAPARRRRHAVRQDQRAAEPGRLAELQRGLRLDQQSVGPVAHAGRLVGRFGCGTRRRSHRPRGRQRHRRLDPQSCRLLRRVGPQADLGRRRDARPCAERQRRPRRYHRVRPAGPRRRRPRDRPGRDGRSRRHRRPRLEARLAALEEEETARLQGCGRAVRPQCRDRRIDPVRDPEARGLPRQTEGRGERHGAGRPSTRPS